MQRAFMRIIDKFKPEYLFNPRQIIRRLGCTKYFEYDALDVLLPWGSRLRIRPRKSVVARAVLKLGIYDLVTSETLWRLTEISDIAVDVGANIGHMTLLMAARADAVVAIEPHPDTYRDLVFNIQTNYHDESCRPKVIQAAASDQSGVTVLKLPEGFDRNCGLASVAPVGDESGELQVSSVTLDDIFVDQRVDVLKIDVEGHELGVLRGAEKLLARRLIRDCVFECHESYPNPVTNYFESFSYTVFGLRKGIFRPILIPPQDTDVRSSWEATNFLATANPERASEKLRQCGWKCLTSQR